MALGIVMLNDMIAYCIMPVQCCNVYCQYLSHTYTTKFPEIIMYTNFIMPSYSCNMSTSDLTDMNV